MKRMLKVLCVIVLLFALVSFAYAMTDSQYEKCKDIIHSTALEGAGSAAATAQWPGVDNVAFVVLVGKMIIQLADVFDTSLSVGNVAATAYTVGLSFFHGGFVAGLTLRATSQWLVGWIPFIGNAVNAATMAGLIEYIGWHVAEQFSMGDFSLLDMDFERK